MKLSMLAGATAIAAATVAASTSAAVPATGSNQATIQISAIVPVICKTQLVGSPATLTNVANGGVQLGSLSEFCNNARGYRVVADYSANLANAKLLVDGVPVPLNKTGSTIVSQSNRAAIASHDLVLQVPRGTAANGNLSFRIEPL